MTESGFDPSPIYQAAVALHEIFITLLKVGFTEDQAIKVVVEMLKDTRPQ